MATLYVMIYVLMTTFVSLVIDVAVLCSTTWINGYYGDLVVLTMCPWELCSLNCLSCEQEKPTLTCVRMYNWTDTGFGKVRVRVLGQQCNLPLNKTRLN